MNATYLRYEILRVVRARRFVVFSIAFPLILYYMIAAPNRSEPDFGGSGISAPLYLMAGLTAFGTMNTVLATGSRIAAERAVGWNRQLRLTPLTTRAYFRTKVLTSYLMAAITIVLIYAAGMTLGVRLSADHWLRMTVLLLIGLIPFAALGIFMGHVLTTDTIGPAMGGTTAFLSLLGGVWFPISSGSALHDVAEALPSYWLVQASHVALGGSSWSGTGWLVVSAWTVAMAVLAARAYQRDTARP
ncbi:MAG TPA: ABC transporter permease [Gaiellales bacterium]|nr:ABC transporter permease [Gaiellales bacterium]